MARIQEEVVGIKFSKLVKDGGFSETIASDTLLSDIEAIVQEMVGSAVMVELLISPVQE